MTSSKGVMGVPGLTSQLVDCSIYTKKRYGCSDGGGGKFADSRSLSWEYNPSGKLLSVAPSLRVSSVDPPSSDTKAFEGPMDIDMEEEVTAGGERQGAVYRVGPGPHPQMTTPASPDLIPRPIPKRPLGSFTEPASQTPRITISKSSSLTSLQQPVSSYFRAVSPQTRAEPRSFRRSTSSQSLSTLPLGREFGTDRLSNTTPRRNAQQAGDAVFSRRTPAKIPTGTMEAISNMIISKSGVSPKTGGGLAGRSPSSSSPHSRGCTPEVSVANTRATSEVKQSPAKQKPSSPGGTASPGGGQGTADHLRNPESTLGSRREPANRSRPKTTVISAMTSSSVQTEGTPPDLTSLATPASRRKAAALTKTNIMTSQVDSVMLASLAGSGVMTSPSASMMCLSGAKEYIMDKYFEEIAKSWDHQDASNSDGPPDVAACGREFSTLDHQAEALRPMLCACGAARSEHGTLAEDSVSLQDQRAPCGHSKTDIRNSYSSSNLRMYTRVNDLIHLEEPLTEEAVIKTLQARFYTGHYYTKIGPLLVLVNPLTFRPVPTPISATVTTPGDGYLQGLLQEATRQQFETGLPQTLILNGVSGSGKTYSSMVLLRRLFDVAGGGAETDAFKHLQAALTVLRALGSAATCQNPHSSRMGYMIENDISDGAIYRTKIHCYFMDQTRVVKPQGNEKNFHIFYQMLAGLSLEERAKYHLTGHSSHTLNFLSSGDVTQNDVRDREHFMAWKNALSVLGIPFADIMRALAAILLLGNLGFVEGPGLELQVDGEPELQAVASLLGVTTASLYRGLSTRTRRARGQIFKALADPHAANQARDSLAKALYCRLVAAIIKRANNTKRLVVNCANSTDSGDSGHNGYSDVAQQEGLLSRSSASRGSGQGLVPSQTESFIGVLDMFGFEKLQTNRFEQLCINLCSETLQHFYNTHMFRAADEACAEEAITADIDVTYADNAPTIELLSSPRVGMLSLLDAECGLQRGCPETLLQKIHIQHSRNKRFFEPTNPSHHNFGIHHFCGDVVYDAKDLLTANRNQLADDIIATFTKQNCSFGFVSHLFSQEIKAIQEDGGGPKGAVYRISPSPVAERSGDLKGSLSSDFHSKLDGILQLLVSSRPHFLRCIKSNDNHQRELFERELVKQQLRSLQLLETLHLMAAGFPHRMRYRFFNSRYQILLNAKGIRSDKQYEESKLILDMLLKTLDESSIPSSNAHWALGKKHIFLSEGCRQLLEDLRDRKRHQAAIIVQSRWRRRMCQKKWPTLKRQLLLRKRDRQPIRKHIRRNSLLEGAALQKLENDQRLQQQTLNSYSGNAQVYVNGNQRMNVDQKGSHYGSHDYIYNQTSHPPQVHTYQDTNGRHAYSSYATSAKQGQGDQVYSKGVHSNREPQPTDGLRRQGSYDPMNRGTGGGNVTGQGRYSFHGDSRPGRSPGGDVCNQRPRSRSTERHYISHADYQRQNGVRQRSYSSHAEFRDSLPQTQHPQPQRHLHNGQGSRLSHSSQASSGSGSLGATQNNTHVFQDTSRHNTKPTGVYGSLSRTNGVNAVANNTDRSVYSDGNSVRTGRPQAGVKPPQHKQVLTNGTSGYVSDNNHKQYYKDSPVKNSRLVNGYDPPHSLPSEASSRAAADLHVTFSPPEVCPPPVPASRTYTVRGNMKLGYPQIRIMKENYQENPSSPKLQKGQEIKVVGAAPKRGYLQVELMAEIIHVPFHLTDLKTVPLTRPGIDV